LNPESGEVFWSVNLKPDYAMSVTAPRLLGDQLFASGIGNVSALLQLAADRPAAEVVWRGRGSNSVYCSNSTPFLEDGVIYGNGCQQGELAAVDLETGERLWRTYDANSDGRPSSHATVFIVKHEDRFFLFNEHGELILANLSRDGYEELGRFKVLEPTNEAFGRPVVWTHPAFANRCVYVRNDEELVCVSIAAE
jgi:outer membrane protein assembly factor BamB